MDQDRTLEQIAADYARHRAAAVESTQRVAEISATVTSPQGLVTVTVGGQGELRSLTFNSQDYRKMAPAELSRILVETVGRARESALQQMRGALPGTGIAGMSVRDMMAGRIDWDRVLPEQLDISGFNLPGRTA
ncbi:YbaB/EbfC family nucleoid-associated protein [Catellatospora methionotrophica]|uniref:YbaB/EbfC family nucleoid-associated protein n=1 Tax=Catellatospora methionotrophica TaxID=121620 RepID=UPI0034062ED9